MNDSISTLFDVIVERDSAGRAMRFRRVASEAPPPENDSQADATINAEPVEYFRRSMFPDDQIAEQLIKRTIVPWRKSKTGEWWFQIVRPVGGVHIEASRNPRLAERDAGLRSRIENGDWPMFVASSALGERQALRLIKNRVYRLWRIEGTTGIWWLKLASDD